jgi:Uma2 family endonuclease
MPVGIARPGRLDQDEGASSVGGGRKIIMATVSKAARYKTIADLLKALGGIAPARVRADPPPGRATEKHLIALNDRKQGNFELVDGTLVEKVPGLLKAFLICELIGMIHDYLDVHDLGVLSSSRGTMRILPGIVRSPDVAFVSWAQLPGRMLPREPIPEIFPELAAEFLSKGNTRGEMKRKLREYFLAGVRLVWLVDPKRRTVEVFTAPDSSTLVTEEQTLDGDDVLPGLALPLRQLFARVPPMSSGKGKKRKR